MDFKGKVKEPLFIRKKQPALNRDGGQNLAAVFNHLLARDKKVK